MSTTGTGTPTTSTSKDILYDVPVSNHGARIRLLLKVKGIEDRVDILWHITIKPTYSILKYLLNPSIWHKVKGIEDRVDILSPSTLGGLKSAEFTRLVRGMVAR
jgi:hypothetical protein